MAAVTDMPADVRATIQNSGTYDRPADERVDLEPFIDPAAAVGSYGVIGPQAAQGCTALSCRTEPNDGLSWLLYVPPTIPGILGIEQRPGG